MLSTSSAGGNGAKEFLVEANGVEMILEELGPWKSRAFGEVDVKALWIVLAVYYEENSVEREYHTWIALVPASTFLSW